MLIGNKRTISYLLSHLNITELEISQQRQRNVETIILKRSYFIVLRVGIKIFASYPLMELCLFENVRLPLFCGVQVQLFHEPHLH